MLETKHNSDDYEESNTSSWPMTGYKFNKEKSGCIDNSGSTIENSLSYDSTTNIVTVDTGVTTKCYIYFDKRYSLEELCTSGEDTLGECLTNNNSAIESLNDNVEGGLYRYQGTQELVDDNYICFGTTDKEECTTNTDAYMYRIIGVDENNQLKLIKKEALNEDYEWHNTSKNDIPWSDSDLFKRLNGNSIGQYGNLFIGNETYVPSGWNNKIAHYEWKYGDSTLFEITAQELYQIENLWANTIKSKIGLMYMHDYYYGLPGGTNCTGNYDYSTCKTSWLYLWQDGNDIDAPNIKYEWTMSRYGWIGDDTFRAWAIDYSGAVGRHLMNNYLHTVRPVFFLNTGEQYISGNGTLDDPIMLSEPQILSEYLIDNALTNDLWKSTLENDGYRYVGASPNNYICFGYEDAKNDCDFTNSTNSNLYAYRIIGIFEDNSGNQHIKLIKKEALDAEYQWNETNEDVDWNNSTLYSYLNGKYFLSNSKYSYMQDELWIDKIATWNYTLTNTLTYSQTYGIHFNHTPITTVYLYELNRSGRVNQICYYDSTTFSSTYCNNGTWKNFDSKIGLLYASDYLLSLGNDALKYTSISDYETLKTGWMHIANNNSGTVAAEWTMTRYGLYNNNYHYVWVVSSNGMVSINTVNADIRYARPVFYLNEDVYIINQNATGTSTDPFILAY